MKWIISVLMLLVLSVMVSAETINTNKFEVRGSNPSIQLNNIDYLDGWNWILRFNNDGKLFLEYYGTTVCSFLGSNGLGLYLGSGASGGINLPNNIGINFRINEKIYSPENGKIKIDSTLETKEFIMPMIKLENPSIGSTVFNQDKNMLEVYNGKRWLKFKPGRFFSGSDDYDQGFKSFKKQ